jgi:hypothetical protein
MLTEFSTKKLWAIAISIAWIDFIASQKCINYQCCPDNFKAFFLFGVAPVAVVWLVYCACHCLKKKKDGAGRAVISGPPQS